MATLVTTATMISLAAPGASIAGTRTARIVKPKTASRPARSRPGKVDLHGLVKTSLG